MKKSPHWSLLHAFRLSKIEITIKHLPSWATTTVSLDTTSQKIVWQHPHFGSPLFRVLFYVSSLDPINIKSIHLPQVFPICSDIPGITAMIPFP